MSGRARRGAFLISGVVSLISVGAFITVTQSPASAASAVTVNGGTTFQTIDGFGVSEAFGQANSIRNLTGTARQQALDLLFNTTTGAGFTILRSIIPSTPADTMEPSAPSSPSATPTYVWDGSNDATDEGQLWLAKQAKAGYGVTTFYNDAWSAPGFMKTNGSEANGGSLCGTTGASCASGDWRQAYANYLTQHAKNWASVGVAPAYVGFVNEPSLTASYSSMLVNPSQATSFLSVFGPTLKASGLSTKATCCDTLGFSLLPSYVSAVSADATANSGTGLFTSHGYSAAPTSPVSSGGRPVWETEWSVNGSTFNTNWDDGTEGSGFTWAQRIQTGMTAANLNAFLYFWGISATSHDSSLIGLSGSTLTPTKRYYAFANYSRFVRPGAVRIGATSGDSNLSVSAYRNGDGSVALVVLNTSSNSIAANYSVSGTASSSGAVTPFLTNSTSSTAAQATIPMSGGGFSATVPARSLVTYRIVGGTVASQSPTSSPSASPTTSPSASPSASPSRTTSPTPTSAGTGCGASYHIDNTWQGGWQTTVTVTNNSSVATTGWTVQWTLASGQTISQLWSGVLSVSGSSVTVRNADYNGAVAPGASTTFGFIGSGSSTPVPVLTCTSS
jgi:O-glycosyl hydrolase